MHTGNKKIIGTKSPFRIQNNVFLLTFTLQKGKSMPKVDRTDELFRRISLQDDEEAFRLLFYDFFAPLCVFAHRYIDEPESCEDIVQETFYRIWKNRKSLCIDTSARNFLLTSVRNSCLDGLRRRATEMRWSEYVQERTDEAYPQQELYTTAELEHLLNAALDKLPEAIASTFRQNRFEGKTYAEIAEEKQLSIKTIEAYMMKALKFLRIELRDYLPFLMLFLY